MKKIVLLALSLVLVPATGWAAPWIEGSAGYGMYAMDDVNDLVDLFNEELAPFGLTMDEVNGGFTFGLGLGFDLPSGVSLGAAYERLTGSTDVGDATGQIELAVSANTVKGLFAYRFPVTGTFRPALGVGAGLVMLASELSATGEGSLDFTGTGPLFEVFGQGELSVAPNLALVPVLGYRHAEVSDVEIEGMDTTDFSVDYSGAFLRLGLRLGF